MFLHVLALRARLSLLWIPVRVPSVAQGSLASAPGHHDRTISSPASYPTQAMEPPSSEVWCQPAGARKRRGRMLLSGLATRLHHAAPSGSWLQGPGVNLQRATVMKPWKTSSATN